MSFSPTTRANLSANLGITVMAESGTERIPHFPQRGLSTASAQVLCMCDGGGGRGGQKKLLHKVFKFTSTEMDTPF